MRRSITSLICGLIGSIFSLAWGFVAGIIGDIGTSIDKAVNGASTSGTVSLIYALGWICFIGAIVGIIGSALCVRRARAGAICLTFATVMCGSLQVYAFVKAQVTSMLIANVIICLLPTVLLAVACVFAWIAKKVDVEPTNVNVASNVTYTKNEANNLENQLVKLKETFEKGLITEEEYKEARKRILDKNM